MPFRLVNALTTFQRYISQILQETLKNKIIIYLDNILLAHKDKEEHQQKIKKVQKLLAKANLKIKESKSKFFKKKLKYLRFILFKEKMAKDPQKTKIIKI